MSVDTQFFGASEFAHCVRSLRQANPEELVGDPSMYPIIRFLVPLVDDRLVVGFDSIADDVCRLVIRVVDAGSTEGISQFIPDCQCPCVDVIIEALPPSGRIES